jgi:hypothetical protein
MATKPTREQQHSCDNLAEALLLITEAARLDGRGQFGAADLGEVAHRLTKAATKIQHTVPCTELATDRPRDFWED